MADRNLEVKRAEVVDDTPIRATSPAPGATSADGIPKWKWALAFAVALAADGLSLIFGTLFAPIPPLQIFLDLCVMAALTLILGFRLAFVPAFALEFFPLASAAPCWTVAVALVASGLRR